MSIIREEYNEPVYAITLNRPESKNALTVDLMLALDSALGRAEEERCPIIVIRGSGGSFCGGGDIREFRSNLESMAHMDSGVKVLNNIIVRIRRIKAIVIAVVEGVAAGAGVSLLSACDLSVAVKSAFINMAYGKLGLTPDGGASLFVPRITGLKSFNEMYFFGEDTSALEAKELGFLNYVCEEGELEERLQDMVAKLRGFSMETVGYLKDLTNRTLYPGLEAHLDAERMYISTLSGRPEFRERLGSFFQKAAERK